MTAKKPGEGEASARVLNIGNGFTMPLHLVTEAVAIVGKRGRGKTSTAKVLVEEMVNAGQQVIVMDTVGAWWGLRSSLDGKSPGLPVVVFGGQHADVPLEDTAGALIARVLMEHKVPAVIDLSGFRKAGQRRFATAFIEELYHSNREPLHVVFDEADEFAPQTPFPEGRALLGAMEDFVRRGRLRGLGCTLVSQRPAVIHKDVLTQVEVLITLGLTGPRDVSAIDEWVKLHADADDAKAVRDSLASLPTGTAWVWSPEWLETLEKVRIRRITTFDSSATPKVGQRAVQPSARATIDLDALGADIAATVERVRDTDPKRLRARVADLEKQLAAKPKAAPAPEPVRVEVPAISDEDRDDLADRARELEELVDAAREQADRLERLVASLVGAIATARAAASAPAPRVAPKPAQARTVVPARPNAAVSAPARQRQPTHTGDADDDMRLSKAPKAITTALATHGDLSARQIGLFTKYAHKSGSFANSLSGLRTRGFIEGTSALIHLTDAGRDALDANGGFDPLPTGAALVQWWLSELPKAQAAMLQALLEVYPSPLSVEELAARTGYAAGSGSFANSRSRLNVAELIHGTRDALYAADTLGEAYLSG